MATVDTAFGPEWAALELVAKAPLAPDSLETLADLLRDGVHWGELLEQALRHKLLPLLATQLAGDRFRQIVPWHVRNHLGAALRLNQHHIRMYRAAAAEIVDALGRAGLPFVATKGITFEATLYHGDGSRYMNDIDFMVRPADRSTVLEIMQGLGFEIGHLEPESTSITPLSRREKVVYQLNPDHLPILTRLTADVAVPSARVDFANSLTWTNSPFDVPVEEALAAALIQPIPGHTAQMPVFSPHYQFIFTALHLFREAWIERWLEEGQDVNLVKFTDLLRLWRTHRDVLSHPDFHATVEKLGIKDPIAWVVTHLDRVMGTEVAIATGLHGQATEQWLASAYQPGGGVRHWRGTMRQRLWAKDRQQLFKEPTVATGVVPL